MDFTGLYATAALPAIVGMYLLRPRVRTRRIAGVFLWSEIAQSTSPASTKTHTAISAILDVATASILIALAGGLASLHSSDQPDTFWPSAVRCMLCIIAALTLIARWRYARTMQVDMRKQA
jgi:hypothetical protein